MSLTLNTRVKMDTTPGTGWLGGTNPDLGEGTVTATKEAHDEGLMAGFYVGVTWDSGRYLRVDPYALVPAEEPQAPEEPSQPQHGAR